jgi:hypothetical protein
MTASRKRGWEAVYTKNGAVFNAVHKEHESIKNERDNVNLRVRQYDY